MPRDFLIEDVVGLSTGRHSGSIFGMKEIVSFLFGGGQPGDYGLIFCQEAAAKLIAYQYPPVNWIEGTVTLYSKKELEEQGEDL